MPACSSTAGPFRAQPNEDDVLVVAVQAVDRTFQRDQAGCIDDGHGTHRNNDGMARLF